MRSKQNRYPIEFKKQIIKEVEETGNATLCRLSSKIDPFFEIFTFNSDPLRDRTKMEII